MRLLIHLRYQRLWRVGATRYQLGDPNRTVCRRREAGARAVIQPGGSLHDEMIVASTGLTMRAKKAAANCGSLPPRSLQKKMLISTTLQRRLELVVLPLTRRRPTRA